MFLYFGGKKFYENISQQKGFARVKKIGNSPLQNDDMHVCMERKRKSDCDERFLTRSRGGVDATDKNRKKIEKRRKKM